MILLDSELNYDDYDFFLISFASEFVPTKQAVGGLD